LVPASGSSSSGFSSCLLLGAFVDRSVRGRGVAVELVANLRTTKLAPGVGWVELALFDEVVPRSGEVR
jgi:hypothetical protein